MSVSSALVTPAHYPRHIDLGEQTREAFAAWNDRRFDEVLEHFHEDAVWDMTPFGLAGVGEYKGHDGLRRFFAEWLEAFPDSSIEVETVEVREPWTLSVVVQHVSGAASQTPVPFRYGGIGRWRDGRLEFVQNHSDLDSARAHFEELSAGARPVDSRL
jgi:ketosteroid isomerase-like protein